MDETKKYKILNVIIVIYFVVAFFTIAYMIADAQSLIEEDQKQALKFTGEYFTDHTNPQFTINTYETICKGYYTIRETDTSYEYIGYGDLAEQYTYDIKKERTVFIASTTKDIDTDIIIDSSTTSQIIPSGIN